MINGKQILEIFGDACFEMAEQMFGDYNRHITLDHGLFKETDRKVRIKGTFARDENDFIDRLANELYNDKDFVVCIETIINKYGEGKDGRLWYELTNCHNPTVIDYAKQKLKGC